MSAFQALSTQAALMDAALRLVDDHADVPAGSVLRCFSRAVVLTRRAGAPPRELAPRAERLTRHLLAARTHTTRRPQWTQDPLPATG